MNFNFRTLYLESLPTIGFSGVGMDSHQKDSSYVSSFAVSFMGENTRFVLGIKMFLSKTQLQTKEQGQMLSDFLSLSSIQRIQSKQWKH